MLVYAGMQPAKHYPQQHEQYYAIKSVGIGIGIPTPRGEAKRETVNSSRKVTDGRLRSCNLPSSS